MRKIITTSSFQIADRYEAWASIANEIGVSGEPPEDKEKPFRASLAISAAASLTLMVFDLDNSPVYRLRPQIRQVEWNQYWMYRELGPGARIDLSGREIITRTGDLVISDADAPLRTLANQTYLHQLWMIPRATLDRHLPPLPRPLAIYLPTSHNVSSLLLAYLDALAARAEELPSALSALVADHLARLIAIAAGSTSKEHGAALRSAKMEQARRYIEENLQVPGLTPERAAAALGISVRQLHLWFEPTGESFGQYVRRRRLQECRAALENPAFLGRSITDIAFGWGFSSLPTFYRAFSDAFGAAPGDLRVHPVGRPR